MHMSDALISAEVGLGMWFVSGAVLVYSAKKAALEKNNKKIPLMGVLAAFVFTAQMINFTIPGTGSSGHLGGGLILSVLLGPYAAFIAMASILTVQSLFFFDGGFLALGCNIFNLGFFSCFVAYPFFYKPIAGKDLFGKKIFFASLIAAVAALQLGAFFVVLQTFFSGISELPFKSFLSLMQPIHLLIGIAEGLATYAIVSFVGKTKPEIITFAQENKPFLTDIRKAIISFSLLALFTGVVFSWFASSNPDGLEWSMSKVHGENELSGKSQLHKFSALVQSKISFLPDYSFKNETSQTSEESSNSYPAIDAGTSVSGFLGGILTLTLVFLLGFILKRA